MARKPECTSTRIQKEYVFYVMKRMYFYVIFIYCLLRDINASIDDDLLVDYFVYEKMSSIVGFSCNCIDDNLILMKRLSKKGIASALLKLHHGINIHQFANTSHWKQGIFLDTRCSTEDDIASALFDATNHRMYDELHYWLILGYNLTDVLRVVNDEAFGISTNFIIAVPGNYQDYELYDVYNAFKTRGGMLNVTFYGEWSSSTGLSIRLVQIKSQRRADLHGLQLTAMYFQSQYRPANTPLNEYYEDERYEKRDGQAKYGYYILTQLSDMFNFTLESIEAPTWLPNDTLGPIAQAMANMEIDITGNPLVITVLRTYLMKFVHENWPFRTCFMFRSPQPQTIKVQEILRPFANSVWFLTCVFLGASLMVLAVTLYYDRREDQLVNVGNSLTMIVGALCQQGTDVKLDLLSSRVAFLFILVFSLLMYNYYSAMVVSARLDEPIFKINDSLNEMMKLRLKWSSERMPYIQNFFKVQVWEVKIFQKEVWNKVKDEEKFMDPETGMRLVQKGGFAYHIHPDVGYGIVSRLFDNREICELTEVDFSRPKMTQFAVTNNSTFTELMRIGLTKISETGLEIQQLQRRQYKKPVCRKDILSATSVDIYEFAPHLILMMIGVLFALIIYAVEIINSNRKIILKKFDKSLEIESMQSWEMLT